jgi:outer membrane protein assembly factor BamB
MAKVVTEGKLTPSALSGLLKKLEGNRSAAYLLVSDGLSEKCLYFSVGAIRLSSVGRRRVRTLDQMLTTNPKIAPPVLERAQQRVREVGETLEDALSNMDYGEVVRECSSAIVRDELLDLIVWEGAYYEYCEANPPPKIFDPRLQAVKLSFGVARVLKEAEEGLAKYARLSPKLASGRARLIRGTQAVYGVPAGVDARVGQAILDLVGENGAAAEDLFLELRRRGFDAIQVTGALDGLLEARALEAPKSQSARVSPEEEAALAKREALEIEAALDYLINELVARQRLAAKYQQLGDRRRAVFNLKRVGEELAARNRSEEAVETFRSVLKLAPTDFATRERILQLYERLKRIPEAVAEGLELARQFGKFGLFNRAKNAFRHVLRLDPARIDVRRELIELLVKLKDDREAVEEYEQLAQILAEEKEDAQLLAVWQQILKLDPKHQAARARILAVARRHWAFLVPYAAVAAGFVLLAAVSAYVISEYRVVRDFNEAAGLALARAADADFAGAREAIDAFVARHAFRQGRAAALRAEVAAMEADWRVQTAADTYGRARALEAAKSVMEARRLYEGLLSSARGTDWEKKAQERLREIDLAADEAERLAASIRRLYHDGKDREAYDAARELIRRYGWSSAAANCDVPLLIESVPAGATIAINGKEQTTRTPRTLTFRPIAPVTLTISFPGFASESRVLDLRDEVAFPYRLELKKALRWKAVALGPVEGPPQVSPDGIFFGARDQRLYAVAPDGRVKWSRALGVFADVLGRPLRAGERLVAGDLGGNVTCLDAESGAVRWRLKLRAPAAGVAAPARDVAIFLEEPATLVGIDVENRKERWRETVPGGLAAPIGLSESEKVLYAATGGAQLIAYDALSGRELGRMSTGARAVASPVPAGSGFLIATEDGLLRLIAASGGHEVWRKQLPAPATAAPLAAGGVAYVAAGQKLLALDLRDGGEKWAAAFRAPVRATPALRAGRLYVGAADGALYRLAAETGALQWTFGTGGEIVSPPVATADTVYVASTDFTVYAIAE